MRPVSLGSGAVTYNPDKVIVHFGTPREPAVSVEDRLQALGFEIE